MHRLTSWPIVAVVASVVLSQLFFPCEMRAQSGGSVSKDDELMEAVKNELNKLLPPENGHSGVYTGKEGYDYGRGDQKKQKTLDSPILTDGIMTNKDVTEIVNDMVAHGTDPRRIREELKAAEDKVGKQSLDEWWKEIARCEGVCSQIMVRIFTKHIERVAVLPHYAIFFPTGDSHLPSAYSDWLVSIATWLSQNRSLTVVLEARASHIGSLQYNRELSRKRADSIKDALVRSGVGPDRVRIIYLGYEPPQIDKAVYYEYRLNDPEVNVGRANVQGMTPAEINQSVVATLMTQ